MKNRTLAFALFACAVPATAQNLVPNGSFEEYTECPPNFGFWENVVGWNCPKGSADYFNSCHVGTAAGVPLNQFGNQYPADGNAYMGVFTYTENGPYVREFLGAQLSQPLAVGVPVHISFKVGVGGYGTWAGNSARYSAKGIGIRFFIDLPEVWNDYLYPNSAAVWLDEVPLDTAVWYTVSGSYVPDSAYTQFVIGNFFEDGLCSPVVLDTLGISNVPSAYAFIDQVCVSPSVQGCSLPQGFSGAWRQPQIVTNPFYAELHVKLPIPSRGDIRFELMDGMGRIALAGALPVGQTVNSIDTKHLTSGTYILRVEDALGLYRPVHLIHLTP